MCQQIHRHFIFASFHRVDLTLLGHLGQKTVAICLLGLCGVPQLSKQKPPNVNDEGGMEDNNGLI